MRKYDFPYDLLCHPATQPIRAEIWASSATHCFHLYSCVNNNNNGMASRIESRWKTDIYIYMRVFVREYYIHDSFHMYSLVLITYESDLNEKKNYEQLSWIFCFTSFWYLWSICHWIYTFYCKIKRVKSLHSIVILLATEIISSMQITPLLLAKYKVK